MATISNNDIARSIYETTRGKGGAELSETSKNIVKFLARKRLLSKSQNILERVEKLINKEDGVLEVKVLSAHHLDDKAKHELKHTLVERYKVKEVKLDEVLDKDLIGGVRIEVNDEVIDLTIKNKITKLKEHLTR